MLMFISFINTVINFYICIYCVVLFKIIFNMIYIILFFSNLVLCTNAQSSVKGTQQIYGVRWGLGQAYALHSQSNTSHVLMFNSNVKINSNVFVDIDNSTYTCSLLQQNLILYKCWINLIFLSPQIKLLPYTIYTRKLQFINNPLSISSNSLTIFFQAVFRATPLNSNFGILFINQEYWQKNTTQNISDNCVSMSLLKNTNISFLITMDNFTLFIKKYSYNFLLKLQMFSSIMVILNTFPSTIIDIFYLPSFYIHNNFYNIINLEKFLLIVQTNNNSSQTDNILQTSQKSIIFITSLQQKEQEKTSQTSVMSKYLKQNSFLQFYISQSLYSRFNPICQDQSIQNNSYKGCKLKIMLKNFLNTNETQIDMKNVSASSNVSGLSILFLYQNQNQNDFSKIVFKYINANSCIILDQLLLNDEIKQFKITKMFIFLIIGSIILMVFIIGVLWIIKNKNITTVKKNQQTAQIMKQNQANMQSPKFSPK